MMLVHLCHFDDFYGVDDVYRVWSCWWCLMISNDVCYDSDWPGTKGNNIQYLDVVGKDLTVWNHSSAMDCASRSRSTISIETTSKVLQRKVLNVFVSQDAICQFLCRTIYLYIQSYSHIVYLCNPHMFRCLLVCMSISLNGNWYIWLSMHIFIWCHFHMMHICIYCGCTSYIGTCVHVHI